MYSFILTYMDHFHQPNGLNVKLGIIVLFNIKLIVKWTFDVDSYVWSSPVASTVARASQSFITIAVAENRLKAM